MLVKFKKNGHVCDGFLFIRTPCIVVHHQYMTSANISNRQLCHAPTHLILHSVGAFCTCTLGLSDICMVKMFTINVHNHNEMINPSNCFISLVLHRYVRPDEKWALRTAKSSPRILPSTRK